MKELTQLQKAMRMLQRSGKHWIACNLERDNNYEIVSGFDVTSVDNLKFIYRMIHFVLTESLAKDGKETVVQTIDILIGRLQQWKRDLR